MTKFITLSSGALSIVDNENFDMLSSSVWHERKSLYTSYAYRCIVRPVRTMQSMHSLVTGFMFVDHANGNGLDNRKSNLRKSNHSLNQGNSHSRFGSTSKYKGVHLRRKSNKWIASITIQYKTIKLGSFNNEEDAAMAYDIAAFEYWGEYAKLNFSHHMPP